MILQILIYYSLMLSEEGVKDIIRGFHYESFFIEYIIIAVNKRVNKFLLNNEHFGATVYYYHNCT